MKGIIVAEGDYEGTVEYPTAEALRTFSDGLTRGCNLYGGGSCSVYTLDDLDDNEVEIEIKDLIRQHLQGSTHGHAHQKRDTATCEGEDFG